MATDYEALDPINFMRVPPGHSYHLWAEFENLAAARRACQALQEAGLAAENVAILGQLGEEVNTASGLSADDRIVLGTAAWRIALGSGLGALVGGVLSLLVGLAVIGTGSGLWAAIIAGAVFGSGVGGVVGGVSITRLGSSQSEMRRRHPELEHAVIGVHADQPEELERAVSLLPGLGPLQFERIQPA